MISVVVPILNECESLASLCGEIAETARRADLDLEILIVDDGSTDQSWEQICALARSDPRVRGIRFRRNFGKAAALSAGFRHAKGSPVVTLDGDLQDDPREIPRLLAALESVDLVSGWKRRRQDPWHKVWPSRLFNVAVSRLSGVRLHDHNSGIKCYRPEVIREIRLYGELHRFIPVLAAARGFRIGEIEVHHRPRRFGRSKYGTRRFIKGFLDLLTVLFLTSFGRRPQHLLGGVGLLSFLSGSLALGYLALIGFWRWWDSSAVPPANDGWLPGYALGAILFGAQLIAMGFVAELTAAYAGRDEDSYSIAELTASQCAPGARESRTA
jgi:glycosyltransferase involved in cell wall biosynthesis